MLGWGWGQPKGEATGGGGRGAVRAQAGLFCKLRTLGWELFED